LKLHHAGSRGSIRGTLLTVFAVALALTAGLWLILRVLPPARIPAQTTPGPATITSPPTEGPAAATDKLLKALNQKLESLDLFKLLNAEVATRPANVNNQVFTTYIENFRLPFRYSAEDLASKLEPEAKAQGAKLASPPVKSEDADGNIRYACSFVFQPGWVAVEMGFIQAKSPKMCLVIDDGGYQKGRELELLLGFKAPLTVALIPGAEFSRELAEKLPKNGVEVMCHMPMQGHEKGKVGNNYREFLKIGITEDEVDKQMTRALDGLPNCRGINNHMGSLATADQALMAKLCRFLKMRELYVIDSRTTAKSVLGKEAIKARLPFCQRNVFLDNVETPEAIQKQMDQALKRAQKRGSVVAIAHFRLKSLEILQEAVQSLKEQGVQFVYASEIVK
jgi:uncharacterized protein